MQERWIVALVRVLGLAAPSAVRAQQVPGPRVEDEASGGEPERVEPEEPLETVEGVSPSDTVLGAF